MPKSNTDWHRLTTQSDAEITAAIAEDPDTFLPDALFWEHAEVVMPKGKQQITLKLDPEVINYFKQQGRGYNTRINAVLKSYVDRMQKSA